RRQACRGPPILHEDGSFPAAGKAAHGPAACGLPPNPGRVRCRPAYRPDRTAPREYCGTGPSSWFARGKHVIDAGVLAKPVAACKRVVFETFGLYQLQACGTAVTSQLAGADQLRVFVSAPGQHL